MIQVHRVAHLVFLAGEGANELGGWHVERAYRAEQPTPGVLETLARHVAPAGWEVRDAMKWKDIPKLQVGSKGKGAERKVILAAHLHAKERGCTVLLFTRDRDAPKYAARQLEIERALDELSDSSVAVAGGVCVERLESWVLAVAGRSKTQAMGKDKSDAELESLGIAAKDTAAMVEHVHRLGIAAVPSDAASLHAWLARVSACLGQASDSP
jgi:hypothetical protein